MAVTSSIVSRCARCCALAAGLAFAPVGGASAWNVYDATGGAEMGGDVVDPNAPGGAGVGPVVADRFFNPAASTLSSVTLNLELSGAPLNGFSVDLWLDSASTPGLPVFGTAIKIATVSDSWLTSSFALYTFTPSSVIMLSANTFYDIGIDTGTVAGDPAVTSVVFGNTVDPAVLGRGPVATGALYFHTVGGVDPNIDGPYELIVNVSVPEPATWAMLFLGFCGLGLAGRQAARNRATVATA
jgi:hypothetical protein